MYNMLHTKPRMNVSSVEMLRHAQDSHAYVMLCFISKVLGACSLDQFFSYVNSRMNSVETLAGEVVCTWIHVHSVS